MRAATSTIAVLVLLAGCATPGADLAADNARLVDAMLAEPVLARSVVVDATRWSGEPGILALADGTLLITGASGFTRYVLDPTQAPGSAGSSYIWRSVDDGATWQFVDLGLPAPAASLLPYRNAILGVEGDLAQDEAGRAYFVDLAGVAIDGVAASDDSGATWLAAQNPAVGLPIADRPWIAALGDGNVYMSYSQIGTGIRVVHSTDAGVTWPEDVAIEHWARVPVADILSKEVILSSSEGSALWLYRTSANGPMSWEKVDAFEVDGEVDRTSVTAAVAGAREYILTWPEYDGSVSVVRASASLDGGGTWSAPINVSTPGRTAVFPWVDANADGVGGVVWYEADIEGPSDAIDAAWYPMHAQILLTRDGLAVGRVTQLSAEKVHQGAVCTDGLGCTLDGRSEDRSLFDFFEIDVDTAGVSHVTWTNAQGEQPNVWYGQVRPGS